MRNQSMFAVGALGLCLVGCLVGAAACSGSTKSTGTNGGSGGGSASDPTGSLDGTWDITTAGESPIGPSQMTLNAGSVTGAIVSENEGQQASQPGCTFSTYRTEFTFNVQGNALNATWDEKREVSPSSCPQAAGTLGYTLTCNRTRTAAASATDMNGDWDCNTADNPTFTVTVDGNAAQAWDKMEKAAGKAPSLTVAIANGVATVTATNRNFTFAAKKR